MKAVGYRVHSLTSTAVHPFCLIFGRLTTELYFQTALATIDTAHLNVVADIIIIDRKLRMRTFHYRGYKRRAQRCAFTKVFLFQPLTAKNLLSDFVRVSKHFRRINMVKILAVFRTVVKNRSGREKRSERMRRIMGSLKRLIAVRQLSSSK